MKHLIKFTPVAHCAMSVHHKGNDQQYCEAGETVRLNWQPSSGWGLLVAGFRDLNDDDAAVTIIDLSTREFTMPDYDIIIMGEARRYNVEQFRSEGEEGQVLGVGPLGSIIPTNIETPTYGGNEGNVMLSDGDGGIVANGRVKIDDDGGVAADGNVAAGGNVAADGNVLAEGYLRLKDTVSGDYYKVEVTNGALVVTAL